MNILRSNFLGNEVSQNQKHSDTNDNLSPYQVHVRKIDSNFKSKIMLSAFTMSKEIYKPESVIDRSSAEVRAPIKIEDTQPQIDEINRFEEDVSP